MGPRHQAQSAAAPTGGSCRILFASISLQPPAETDLRQLQHALATTLHAGLHLQSPASSSSSSASASTTGADNASTGPLPLGWLRLPSHRPMQQPAAAATGPALPQLQLPGKRRFPQSQPQQQATNAASTSTAAASAECSASSSSSKHNALRTRRRNELHEDQGAVCVERGEAGRQRVYQVRRGEEGGEAWEGFDMVEDPQTYPGRARELARSYLLPQGFPGSVAPQYATYMGWRGVQYFFGGAMSVFTTQSLLGALGMGRHKGEAAAAINWVLKDGAGRLGRFLFARWGRELDCELKQFRLAGDVLMEAGAAMELSTILMPRAFLPLACTANLAKNLAAVAASSTRAPIYRTFALQNNLADVTAKGESVANLADIAGTLAGIALSKAKLPMFPTFVVLSAGYLLASRREVDSVELPYLNRARLSYTTRQFLATGSVPGIHEANKREPLLPWGSYHQGRVVLGARVADACSCPAELQRAAAAYKGERFVMTYRPDTKKVYILLRDTAQVTDYLKAAFSAHVLLHLLDAGAAVAAAQEVAASGLGIPVSVPMASVNAHSSNSSNNSSSNNNSSSSRSWSVGSSAGTSSSSNSSSSEVPGYVDRLAINAAPLVSELRSAGAHRLLDASKGAVDALYPDFLRQADRLGWKLGSTMLNPKETRLVHLAAMPLQA